MTVKSALLMFNILFTHLFLANRQLPKQQTLQLQQQEEQQNQQVALHLIDQQQQVFAFYGISNLGDEMVEMVSIIYIFCYETSIKCKIWFQWEDQTWMKV